MKKLVAAGLIFIVLLGIVSCGEKAEIPGLVTTSEPGNNGTEPVTDRKEPQNEETEEDAPVVPQPDPVFTGEEKVIDIFLIAGQSNAVGYTKITDRSAAYEFAPELEKGFSNVLFAGKTRWDSGASYEIHDFDWYKTTLGLAAISNGYMGPEAGMAKALSEYYNEESGRVAGLIKFGHGGTSLMTVVNSSTSGSNRFGTWVSPSYAKYYLGMEDATYNSGKTGALYREFLKVVREKLIALVDEGYTNVNMKGLYWMQGENDRNNPSGYVSAFECFVSDLRRDLSAMLTELTGTEDDRGASQMPVFVGTISQTQNLNSSSAESVNKNFIAMQKTLPDRISECYVVDNSAYRISQYNPDEPSKPITAGLGSDQWHWNQSDHLAIGYNVGKAILNCYGDATD